MSDYLGEAHLTSRVQGMDVRGLTIRYKQDEGMTLGCECGYVVWALPSEGGVAVMATAQMGHHLRDYHEDEPIMTKDQMSTMREALEFIEKFLV